MAGSFRDPAGHVFESHGRIYRVLSPSRVLEFEASRSCLEALVQAGRLVDFKQVDAAEIGFDIAPGGVVLEHPKLAFWSMPYEWSFPLLQAAALFHLELHLDLLEAGFNLSDASAYNVQFVGPRPIFIDHLSIRPYREGEFWLGHKQFCEQFLNPLLLRSLFGVAHNSWYRGNLEGIPTLDLARLLSPRHAFSWRMLSNVILPARFQRNSTSDKPADFSLKGRQFPRVALIRMLRQLHTWIGGLRPSGDAETTWGRYATTSSYTDQGLEQKRAFVATFVKSTGVKTVIDLGCNVGEYCKTALESGAEYALGFDFDQDALSGAYQRAKREDLKFLPLYLDARNPSPDQGWYQRERSGFSRRARGDGVLALAFEHHLAIAHNIPLDQVTAWITDIAPKGVIEFVPKSDPTIQKMLALREDVFPEYCEEEFCRCLTAKARIVRKETVSGSERALIEFDRI